MIAPAEYVGTGYQQSTHETTLGNEYVVATPERKLEILNEYMYKESGMFEAWEENKSYWNYWKQYAADNGFKLSQYEGGSAVPDYDVTGNVLAMRNDVAADTSLLDSLTTKRYSWFKDNDAVHPCLYVFSGSRFFGAFPGSIYEPKHPSWDGLVKVNNGIKTFKIVNAA